MNNNVTLAVFGAYREVKTRALWQYDYGQILRFTGLDLPDAYEVHFANSRTGSATTQIGNADGVVIPDIYLTTGQPVYAWLYLHTGADDGETEYAVTIPVNPRARPTDQPPTPVQQDAITQAIAVLNVAITQAGESADAAEQSATEAAASAESATESVTLAESWAIGGTGQREGEDTNNAKFWSEMAQQHAADSGWAFFDIDDQTGQMIVVVSDDLSQDVTFAVNENTGELEVTVI